MLYGERARTVLRLHDETKVMHEPDSCVSQSQRALHNQSHAM